MFDIGFLEILLVGVIALLVLGPERLPGAARTAGKWVGKARGMVSQVTQEIDREIKAEELREKLKKEGDTLGLEKIQGTVTDALSKAKDFEHLVEKEGSHLSGSETLSSNEALTTQEKAPNQTATDQK